MSGTTIPIFDLDPLSAAPVPTDVLPIVDVTDTTQSSDGSTKKITVAELFTSVTITSALSVNGAVTVTGTASVSGAVNLASTLNVAGDTVVAGTLNVTATNGMAIGSVLNRLRWSRTGPEAVELVGDSNANANLTVLGLTALGTATISGTITSGVINGQTINATASLTGTLDVAGNFSIATNKFTVAAASGNTVVAGTLGVTGASTLTGALTVNNNVQLGPTVGTTLVTIGGTGFGAGNASLRFNGLSTGAGIQTGTLLTAPSAGDPAFWLPISIAGSVRYIPCWA